MAPNSETAEQLEAILQSLSLLHEQGNRIMSGITDLNTNLAALTVAVNTAITTLAQVSDPDTAVEAAATQIATLTTNLNTALGNAGAPVAPPAATTSGI